MDYMQKIEKLASLIKEHERFYVLTGAGISTASGVPDFRSPGTGIWEKVDPIATSSVDVLQNNPRTFYEQGFKRFARISSAKPNQGHYLLARLEELGYLKGLVTQNIDGLHVEAGSKKVWEVHGHLRTGHCLGCKMSYPFDELMEQVEADRIPPTCHNCHSMLRPDVVLFGDPMPSFFLDLHREIKNVCDFMLVVGSSLVVYPVADLPRLAGKMAIINNQPTDFDDHSQVFIREDINKVLGDLLQLLDNN